MSASRETLRFEQVAVGDELPALTVPITARVIVAGAVASRDSQDVHHDYEAAVRKGTPNIFMNILTTNGWVGRFVTDWAGPNAMLRGIAIRLGAPNFPGDTMVMRGTVTSKDDSVGLVEVSIQGKNQLGDHVTGSVRVVLPQ